MTSVFILSVHPATSPLAVRRKQLGLGSSQSHGSAAETGDARPVWRVHPSIQPSASNWTPHLLWLVFEAFKIQSLTVGTNRRGYQVTRSFQRKKLLQLLGKWNPRFPYTEDLVSSAVTETGEGGVVTQGSDFWAWSTLGPFWEAYPETTGMGHILLVSCHSRECPGTMRCIPILASSALSYKA